MLGMGPMEIAVILIIALIIFGPGKLPEIGQTLGRAVRDFRAATDDITGDFKQTMNEFQQTADDFKSTAVELRDEAEGTFKSAQGEFAHAAEDIEGATRDLSNDVNDGLQLDQIDSPVTRPAKPQPALSARASGDDEHSENVVSNRTGKPAAKKTASTKTKSSSKASTKTGKSSKTSSKKKSDSKNGHDAERKQARSRKRTPATVSASSSPSKDDPLADLMGVDDGPITSRASRRTNGRG